MNGPPTGGDRPIESHLSDAHALVVGESLVDIVRRPDGETQEYAGGSAANVAVALARLGRPVRFATAYAADPHGAMVSDTSAPREWSSRTTRGRSNTATAAATIGNDGAASYEFDLTWQLNPCRSSPRRSSCTPARWGQCSNPGPPTSSACWNGCARAPP